MRRARSAVGRECFSRDSTDRAGEHFTFRRGAVLTKELEDYIDGLDDEARDRVITAQGWCSRVHPNAQGAGCLISPAEPAVAPLPWAERGAGWRVDSGEEWQRYAAAAGQYDDAVKKYGLVPVVAALKARAARPNRVTLTPSETK